MALGFTGPAGIAGGYQALDEILAQRIKAKQAEDAARQQAIENAIAQRELAIRERPTPRSPIAVSPGQTVISPETGQPLFEAPDRPAPAPSPRNPLLVSPGQTVYDPTGGALYTAPTKPEPPKEPDKPIVVNGSLVDPRSGRIIATIPTQTPAAPPATNDYAQERGRRTVDAVKSLINRVSRRTAGIGSLLSGVPETAARNFAAELETLKSNIAFKELTEMREASKTGGALGPISDRENQLLASSLGALDQGQSPENLKAQLWKIKGSIERWEAAKAMQGQGAPNGISVSPSSFKVLGVVP